MDTAALNLRGMLPRLPLLEEMGSAALDRLFSGATLVNAPSRTVIFKCGDTSRGVYIVVSGQVKLALQGAQGAEQVVELVGPGGVFGEIPVFLGGPHVLMAESLADSRVVQIAKSNVLAELEHTPEFTREMLAILSRRLQHVLGALENCTLRSGTERVIAYLMSRLPPDAINGHAVLTLPAKKGVIASQLNLTHEHFSRLLHELVSKALIEVEGRRVRILDVDRLRAYGFD
jgi:CRP-like cAMP-binding protein